MYFGISTTHICLCEWKLWKVISFFRLFSFTPPWAKLPLAVATIELILRDSWTTSWHTSQENQQLWKREARALSLETCHTRSQTVGPECPLIPDSAPWWECHSLVWNQHENSLVLHDVRVCGNKYVVLHWKGSVWVHHNSLDGIVEPKAWSM